MTRQKLAAIIAVVTSMMILAACTGQGSENVAQPVETNSAATSSPSETPSTEPSVAPEPSIPPGPTPIAADDLVVALPTNKQMSKIQGYKFNENTNWVGGADEGPEWSNNTPLTKEQKNVIQFGTSRAVKPERCSATSASYSFGTIGGGIPSRWAVPNYASAAAYSYRVNNYRYFKKNLVNFWSAMSFLLPEGEAQKWATNWINMSEECAKFTVIEKTGDVTKINTNKSQGDFVSRSSGGAYLQVMTKQQSKTLRGNQFFSIRESIGKVLYLSNFYVLGADKSSVVRAFEVYNVLADNLADVQGVTRTPVDLVTSTKITPNPESYVQLSVPSNEIT